MVCRLLNAKFTVLGEVKLPGTYTFYENNLTLLQALGLAGDLTINGVRKKITIIRTENGKQTYGTIDLTKNDWFNTPFYFGGTSLLIIVVVTMDFMTQVQSHLMSHQYEGLLKKANFKGGASAR